MEIIDLSLPVTEEVAPFRDASGYSDPPTIVAPWVRIGQQVGRTTSLFHVSLLQMGLHTGSHVDAPSHFHLEGPTVSDLPLRSLAGRAAVLDLRHTRSPDGDLLAAAGRMQRADVLPLVLTPPDGLSLAAAEQVILWDRPLLVFAGAVDAEGSDFPITRRLLGADRWIVTDLVPEQAARVRDGDLLVVAPLGLEGLEASPCRVLAIR